MKEIWLWTYTYIVNIFNNNGIFKYIKTIIKSSSIPPLVYLDSMLLNHVLKSLICLIVRFSSVFFTASITSGINDMQEAPPNYY